MILHVDSKDSDQTGQIPRLNCVFAGHTGKFVGFVMLRLIYASYSSSASPLLCLLYYELCHEKTCPCEQQRRRSACAYAQSDQRLCCSLLG